jgi:hypothetical protein
MDTLRGIQVDRKYFSRALVRTVIDTYRWSSTAIEWHSFSAIGDPPSPAFSLPAIRSQTRIPTKPGGLQQLMIRTRVSRVFVSMNSPQFRKSPISANDCSHRDAWGDWRRKLLIFLHTLPLGTLRNSEDLGFLAFPDLSPEKSTQRRSQSHMYIRSLYLLSALSCPVRNPHATSHRSSLSALS